MSFNPKLPLILLLLNAIPAFCLWMDHRDRVARNKMVADCIDVRISAEASPRARMCSAPAPTAGSAYSCSGDQDRAIDDLDTAIGLDRGYARAYALRPCMRLAAGGQ
jgi:hypothetical protein